MDRQQGLRRINRIAVVEHSSRLAVIALFQATVGTAHYMPFLATDFESGVTALIIPTPTAPVRTVMTQSVTFGDRIESHCPMMRVKPLCTGIVKSNRTDCLCERLNCNNG